MLQSHAKNIIVADFDELDGSNLNRIRSGWQNLGKMKLTLVSQSLYEQNPYCQITCVPGISINESKALLHQTPPIDAIIDSLDNLDIKLELRQLARQLKIPLIMATDIDTTIKIDIERHDVCHTPFFNGSIPEDEITTINSLNETQRRKLAIKLVGLENNSLAMMHSLKEIKKSIPTWPQLGATATMAGGIITTIITKIIQKKSVKSGTYWVNLDSIFESDYELKTTERQKTRQALERHLKLN